MCKGGFHNKGAISYPVLFCLITVLSHCFAQDVYDYSDYSYRHGRDYQYEEEYVDDYDKTGKWNYNFIFNCIFGTSNTIVILNCLNTETKLK